MPTTGAIQNFSREVTDGIFHDQQLRRQRRVLIDLPRGDGTA